MLNGQVHLGCSPSPDGSQQVLHFALQKQSLQKSIHRKVAEQLLMFQKCEIWFISLATS